ncbi:MAG: 23S rRNA (pseudouridine(1915)-N(3))-methyltransferase RlmH [Bacilli bacterium]|nr:23S rRNA (pseudouridine(1915)-N(3))-methyltransferase RlmH [Bacilli bacterium]
MKITVFCIGFLKESYWKEAVSEYQKRLGNYVALDIVEIGDLPCPEKASPKEMDEIKRKEGQKILSKLKSSDYLIALDLKGKQYDSISFAHHIEEKLVQGGASLSFVIGGSLGLSEELLKRANESVCFGLPTFPHQLARVMLLEQLYRSFRILRNEPYHK